MFLIHSILIQFALIPWLYLKSTDRGNTGHVLYPASSDITGSVFNADHAQEIVVTKDST